MLARLNGIHSSNSHTGHPLQHPSSYGCLDPARNTNPYSRTQAAPFKYPELTTRPRKRHPSLKTPHRNHSPPNHISKAIPSIATADRPRDERPHPRLLSARRRRKTSAHRATSKLPGGEKAEARSDLDARAIRSDDGKVGHEKKGDRGRGHVVQADVPKYSVGPHDFNKCHHGSDLFVEAGG